MLNESLNYKIYYDYLEQLAVIEEALDFNNLIFQKKSFECLFDNTPDAIVRFDNHEQIVMINTKFTELFGYSKEEIIGKNINEVIDKEKRVQQYASPLILKGETILFHDAIRYDKNNHPVDVMLRGAPIIINEKIYGGYVIYTDIREKKRAEEKIAHQKKILESLFLYSPDAIAYLDISGNIINVNNRFVEMFGYTIEECRGKNLDVLITDEGLYKEATALSQQTTELSHVEVETIRKRKDGTYIPVSIRGGPTIVNDRIIGFHGFYTDISERKSAAEKIKFLSFHDKLTALYNRAFFDEELERLDTIRQLPISIIIGDVNGLKLANDVFGHEEGDRLLIKIAEIMKRACRKEDIVARWGGDEFAIILPSSSDKTAKEICNRIKQFCSEAGENPIKISISLGHATKNKENEEIREIIKLAEERMYRKKLTESKSIRSHIISSLQKSLLEKNHVTKEHGEHLKNLGARLGRHINLSDDEINDFGLLALLHDIGKIAISENILNKNGKLSVAEWEEIKRHCEIGYRIAETSPDLFHIAKYILFHHERWDGTGYPNGLKGDEIPLLSRMLAIIDAYDIMTTHTSYQKQKTHREAIAELKKCAGSQFDPSLVDAFIKTFEEA